MPHAGLAVFGELHYAALWAGAGAGAHRHPSRSFREIRTIQCEQPFPTFLGSHPPMLGQIREWSKRVGLDGAITNLPKMSSLILRWSLDNTSQPSPSPPPPRRPPASPSSASDGGGGGDARDDGSRGKARQRELRSSLQVFLEVRQVWRLLSGRGETDPAVLSIAGERIVQQARLSTGSGRGGVAVEWMGLRGRFDGGNRCYCMYLRGACLLTRRVVLSTGDSLPCCRCFGCSGGRFALLWCDVNVVCLGIETWDR